MSGKIRVGLLWHAANSSNLGMGALTAGNLALARKAAAQAGVAAEFIIISAYDPGPPALADEHLSQSNITGRYMISPGGFLADMRACDIMLDISGGDSFADIYPNKRFAYITSTKILPILAGTPLVLSPQTIGPFSRQPHSAIAAWICRKARAVFVRDALSGDALAALAPGVPFRQVVDVAFAMPFTQAPRRNDRVQVGLNVSGLLMNGGYGGNNQYGLGFDYPALTHRVIESLLARGDTDIHLVPHVIARHMPVDDDGAAADQLQARYPALIRHPDFTSPSAAKSFISGMNFFVGARMHATIGAFSTGVPVVPISYSRKFEGLFGSLGYDWLVRRDMTTDDALNQILAGFENRARLATDIASATPAIQAGLSAYVDALARLFADVAR
jgi:polysaccharide pyruvyl transferase WcaK-like protein